jgi:hypothetical protein
MKLILLLLFVMSFEFEEKHLIMVRDEPHKLGHAIGMTKLTPMHSKWIIDVWDNNIPLQAHRGSYKTTAVTELGTIRRLLFFPDRRIGIFRNPYSEAKKSVDTIVKYMQTDILKALFYYAHGIVPKVVKKDKGLVIYNFKSTITKEGSLNAYGIHDPKTGSHLDDALGDDCIVMKDRTSQAFRNKTNDGIIEVQTNILDEDQPFKFLGTPWHKLDGWQHFKDPKKYDCYSTGLLDEKTIESKKKKTTKSLFACNWELIHKKGEDMIFSDPVYGRWDWTVPDVVGHLDAKYGGNHTNGLTFGASRPDGKIQMTGYMFEEHVDEVIDKIKNHYDKRRCTKLYNEQNADKGYLAKDLRKKGINIPEDANYHETWNKHNKIVALLKPHWNDIIWDENIDPKYMEQVVDYMEGQEPDDCPDSAASLLLRHFYPEIDESVLWD